MSDNALAATFVALAASLVIFFAVVYFVDGQKQARVIDAFNKCVEVGNTPADCSTALD